MSATTRIEIAATPEVVRKAFLDFENFSRIGDALVRSIALVGTGSPTKGSILSCNFKGIKSEVTVIENSPERFSWRGNVFFVLTGTHVFSFQPSAVTPGHTTFVNTESFERLMWVSVKTGVIDGEADFNAFNVKFKAYVEGLDAGSV